MKGGLNVSNMLKLLKKELKLFIKDDKGQAAVLVAVSLAVLLGFGALTTDLGFLYVQRRSAQNIADSAALAGTWAIQDGEEAVKAVIEDYAEKNGIFKTDIKPHPFYNKFIVDNKFVKVVVDKEHELFLAKALNMEKPRVGAEATATRSSIWKPGFRDLLPVGLTRYEDYFYEEVEVIGKNGKITTELQLNQSLKAYLEGKHPSMNVENGLKNNRAIYKEALEYFIDNDPTKIFDLVLGDSKFGSFGFIDLDGSNGGGANITGDWIDNGYNGILNIIISENGNMATLDSNLKNYIKTRGEEAYIVAILPRAIDEKPNNWKAESNEYLIIHVKNLKLIGSGGSAKLTGTLNEIFIPGDKLLPGQTNIESLPQSWLVKHP